MFVVIDISKRLFQFVQNKLQYEQNWLAERSSGLVFNKFFPKLVGIRAEKEFENPNFFEIPVLAHILN